MKVLINFMWWKGHCSRSIGDLLKISNHATIACCTKCFRRVAVHACEVISEPIGGEETIVEIDESKFGKSKFSISIKKNYILILINYK